MGGSGVVQERPDPLRNTPEKGGQSGEPLGGERSSLNGHPGGVNGERVGGTRKKRKKKRNIYIKKTRPASEKMEPTFNRQQKKEVIGGKNGGKGRGQNANKATLRWELLVNKKWGGPCLGTRGGKPGGWRVEKLIRVVTKVTWLRRGKGKRKTLFNTGNRALPSKKGGNLPNAPGLKRQGASSEEGKGSEKKKNRSSQL